MRKFIGALLLILSVVVILQGGRLLDMIILFSEGYLLIEDDKKEG